MLIGTAINGVTIGAMGPVFSGIAVFADCCTDSNSTLSGLKTEDYQEVG